MLRRKSRSHSTDYHKIAEAFGGYGEKVDDPAKLKGAIGRALEQVVQGRQATLNVVRQRQ